MTKQVFLAELRSRLSGLPEADLQERLSFYSEMIDDRMEEAIPEEEAVAQVGSIDDIVAQILADYPLTKIVKDKIKPKRRLRAWEIVLLILGSPLWLSLLIAACAILLAVYIVIWSVDISLWAAELTFAFCSVSVVTVSVMLAAQGSLPAGIASLGLGIFGFGSTILLFFGCKAATLGVLKLTKKMFFGMKTMLIGKERNQ